MPSGKKSRAKRQAAQQTPPPVRSKGARAVGGAWLSGARVWWLGGGAAVTVVIVVAIVLAAGGSVKPVHVDFARFTGLQTGPPPWNNASAELQQNLPLAYLDALPAEALAFHVHDHLDVYVNGKHVPVAAQIGIDAVSITELHTHATDGVLHVESATDRPYVLGQFFGEWAVRLTANCLGSYCGHLHWWVDGQPQTGNPADLNLVSPHPHKEIVIAVGKPPAHIPSSYAFPPGE